jgi:hypothetical protein
MVITVSASKTFDINYTNYHYEVFISFHTCGLQAKKLLQLGFYFLSVLMLFTKTFSHLSHCVFTLHGTKLTNHHPYTKPDPGVPIQLQH